MVRRVVGSSPGEKTGHSPRTVSSSGRDLSLGTKDGRKQDHASDSGAFVDARELKSSDVVIHALDETSGSLGVPTRPKIVDFNERQREHRRANMRVIAYRLLAAVVLIALCGVLVWLLFFSSVLRLETENITISGANEWVSNERIMQIASKEASRSLLLVSTNDVVEQLQAIPGVTKATATKDFPNGLHVEVDAHKPAAMLKTPDGTLTAVDEQGRILNAVDGASNEGIPVIEFTNVEHSLKGPAVREALTILSALPDDMRARITKVSAATQDSITTELDDGQRVIVWGDSSQLELKMAVVDKIINDPSKIGDKHQVDVSAPLRPIIK